MATKSKKKTAEVPTARLLLICRGNFDYRARHGEWTKADLLDRLTGLLADIGTPPSAIAVLTEGIDEFRDRMRRWRHELYESMKFEFSFGEADRIARQIVMRHVVITYEHDLRALEWLEAQQPKPRAKKGR